jgi:hypothetical protein
MSDGTKKRAIFDQQNAEAAAVILADPAKYGGESSLMVEWARAFTAGQQARIEPRQALFETEAA